jgi:hypothetical protein
MGTRKHDMRLKAVPTTDADQAAPQEFGSQLMVPPALRAGKLDGAEHGELTILRCNRPHAAALQVYAILLLHQCTRSEAIQESLFGLQSRLLGCNGG